MFKVENLDIFSFWFHIFRIQNISFVWHNTSSPKYPTNLNKENRKENKSKILIVNLLLTGRLRGNRSNLMLSRVSLYTLYQMTFTTTYVIYYK